MQLQINIENKSPIDLKLELLEESLNKVRSSSENVRKGLFARHNELAKMYLEIKETCEKQNLIIEELKSRLERENEQRYIQDKGSSLSRVTIVERAKNGFIGYIKTGQQDFAIDNAKCVSIGA